MTDMGRLVDLGAKEDVMDRDRKIELLASARERLSGYISAWIRDSKVKAALHRPIPGPQQDGEPAEPRRPVG